MPGGRKNVRLAFHTKSGSDLHKLVDRMKLLRGLSGAISESKVFMKTRLTGMVILTSALTLGIGGDTHIQAPTSNGTAETGPRIQFADPIFDFGKVGSGQVIRHDFVFTNTGN